MNVIAFRAGLPPTNETLVFTVYGHEVQDIPRVGEYVEHGTGDDRKMYRVTRVDHILSWQSSCRIYVETEK